MAALLINRQAWTQVILTSTNLPIVLLETNGLEIPEDEKITIDMQLIYHGPGVINHIDDNVYNYNGQVRIEKRGSSSIVFPKSSYSFETVDSTGANLNVSLVDLPEENDWVLYGPYSDKSLMRNVITYELARRIGWYAPRTRMCEVVLNEEYMGVYVLVELIKRDDNRVNISKLTENDTIGDDLTGGYILRVDRHEGGGWHSLLNYNIYFQYIYPDDDEILPVQETYIQEQVNGLESFLETCSGEDQDSIESTINTANFIDYIILNELAKNMDAYRLSTYFYKDKNSEDPRIHMGPLWDYNIAYGNFESNNGWQTSGCVFDNPEVPFYPYTLFWFRKLMELDFFQDQFDTRWQTLKSSTLHPDSIFALIDSVAYFIDEPQARNFEQWDILDQYIWPNYYIGETYEDEVFILKDWISNRIDWMDFLLSDSGNCCPAGLAPPPEFTIYPQPVDDYFTLYFPDKSIRRVTVILLDWSGREYLQEDVHINVSGKVQIDLHHLDLKAGLYFVQCQLQDSTLITRKLIKR